MVLVEPLVIELEGDLDIAQRNALEWRLKQALFTDPVILDFSRVHYIDTTCLSALIRMRKTRLAKGYRPAALVMPSPQLRRLFRITELDAFWPIFDSRSAAEAALE